MKELNLNIFPSVSKEKWKQLAEKQLKGADPSAKLTWLNAAKIEIEAYYDQEDTANLKYLHDFFSQINSHKWKLYEEVQVLNAKQANEKILKALMGGCDGIILKVEDDQILGPALEGVDRTICDISLISSKEVDSVGLNGFKNTVNGNCLYLGQKDDPIDQLVSSVSKISNHSYLYRYAFKDFFLEIASIRALRFLLGTKGLSNIHIHTQIRIHESTEHQWFLNTSSAIASILGGSHSIDLPTAMGDSRISRNVGNLIREESGINEYSDQCRGSFYIEALTDKIVNEVNSKLK
ncbi:methylmalonyl-CoA mutase family protein [Ekhidna sp.]|uniref:methylmalonyl-CoA mutase family protein n=2 Tax=Ekhidna sp. TaxID=2608089 RepID=UPI003296C175